MVACRSQVYPKIPYTHPKCHGLVEVANITSAHVAEPSGKASEDWGIRDGERRQVACQAHAQTIRLLNDMERDRILMECHNAELPFM